MVSSGVMGIGLFVGILGAISALCLSLLVFCSIEKHSASYAAIAVFTGLIAIFLFTVCGIICGYGFVH
ncbi:MAG: hypothetical protein A2V72_00405 [Candidatus Nealsonbacteria bacterium RBG_13_37_56]|uniref:Uncharacterized protein n=1 Tax=Candidatus Nealsonbacteria bacterium RBG_13_37_56 TaxID=1801661 RepID=A0A1G2DWN3_9BACT|nr:MAG: hypothetical protein A2V72_00405 [Candidatus Nealsonbacteria bacterium RBG_13_37_56]